jgi:hypothetical protein
VTIKFENINALSYFYEILLVGLNFGSLVIDIFYYQTNWRPWASHVSSFIIHAFHLYPLLMTTEMFKKEYAK